MGQEGCDAFLAATPGTFIRLRDAYSHFHDQAAIIVLRLISRTWVASVREQLCCSTPDPGHVKPMRTFGRSGYSTSALYGLHRTPSVVAGSRHNSFAGESSRSERQSCLRGSVGSGFTTATGQPCQARLAHCRFIALAAIAADELDVLRKQLEVRARRAIVLSQMRGPPVFLSGVSRPSTNARLPLERYCVQASAILPNTEL